MMSNTEELQYGDCCCCLEKGDHRELTKQYYLNEQPEIYEVLFKDTFDIVLKYPENTKLICDCCIEQLRQANRFRFMVESSQQTLSDRVNWQPEIVNGVEDLLKQSTIESLQCDPDNQMEEADNDVKQPPHIMAEVNNDTEETGIKEENSDVEEPSQLTVSISIKRESDNDNSVVENPLGQLNTEIYIKCEPDNQVEESDNDMETKHTMEEVNNDMESSDISTYNNVLEQPAKKLHLKQQNQFYCTLCQYKTTSKSSLINHMRTHTGEKPFSCKICPYKAAEKVNLTRHMHTHTAARPFSCDVCQYKTAIKGNLTIHLRSHTGEKPFSCVLCKYKAVGKNGLARHMRTHTGEKPFSCDVCEYKASRRAHLTSHIRIHTREKLVNTKSQKSKFC